MLDASLKRKKPVFSSLECTPRRGCAHAVKLSGENISATYELCYSLTHKTTRATNDYVVILA